jgi:hypothetical protein
VAPEGKREEGRRMLALGEFILRSVRTTINVKRWWQLRQELRAAKDAETDCPVLARMKTLAEAELENVAATVPLVEFDSRLGWEPSMEYMTDPEHLQWKIAQLRHVLGEELPAYRHHLENRG